MNSTKKAKNTFRIIKDPIYGSMQFTAEEFSWILPFIDSENFQRLRHIKQAGLCDWFFPGAVHTRFNHSLGCCFVAGQIANKIGLSAQDKQTVMLAGLLHDIGHGPCSHAFEPIFYKKSINHEMWTPYFLNDFSQPDFLKKINPTRHGLAISNSTFKLVERIIMHKEKRRNLLADIISSQLDADRLDYLRRDSYFCGVTYGQYDFRWLLHCLTVVSYQGKKRLGITHNGVGVIEHYLMARRLMTRNVYLHHKKYAAEYLLHQFIKYLAEGLTHDPQFAFMKNKTLAKFIICVNDFNIKMRHSKNKTRTIQTFLKNTYEQYRQLCDYDIFSMLRHCASLDTHHPAASIAKKLQWRQLPKVMPVHSKNYHQAKKLVTALKQQYPTEIQDWQIAVLSLPHQSYSASDDPIIVKNDDGSSQKIHDKSLIMSAISDQWENISMVCIDHDIFHSPLIKHLRQQLAKLI